MANQYLAQAGVAFSVLQNILFYILFALVILANREIRNKLKLMWLKRKAAVIELIGSDMKASQIIVKKKNDYTLEFENHTFFINSLRAVERNGIKIYTHVMGNAFGHNYTNDPKAYLNKMISDTTKEIKIKDKKGNFLSSKDLTDSFHNVYDESYRLDGRMLQETLYNAQLSNKELWEEIIKFFKSKNLLTYGIIIMIGVGLVLLVSFGTYNKLVNIPVCQMPKALTV